MNTTKAIEQVQHCTTMTDVRRCVDALDDVLVPLLVQRSGYMTQAARIKQQENQVRDEERIQAIVDRVRKQALAEGGEPAVIEAIYRSMMEVCISFEHREFARLRQGDMSAAGSSQGARDPSGGSAVHAVTSVGVTAL
jgi:isochorismate pyruvate lyase